MGNMAMAQGFDWHRINIAVDASTQLTATSVLQLGSGVLANRPNRSVSLAVNYRLWQHWEVGLYANLVGSNAMSSGGQDIGNGQSLQWIFVTNGYEVGWGVTAQFHIIPYRFRHEMGLDMTLRLGFDFGEAEADNFWGGLRYTYNLSRHVALSASFDFGSFYFAGYPSSLGMTAMDVNAVLEIEAYVTPNKIHGWDTSSTGSA